MFTPFAAHWASTARIHALRVDVVRAAACILPRHDRAARSVARDTANVLIGGRVTDRDASRRPGRYPGAGDALGEDVIGPEALIAPHRDHTAGAVGNTHDAAAIVGSRGNRQTIERPLRERGCGKQKDEKQGKGGFHERPPQWANFSVGTFLHSEKRPDRGDRTGILGKLFAGRAGQVDED
jgi:hypothetical protein